MTLSEIITMVRDGNGPERHWYFIRGAAEELTCDTECEFAEIAYENGVGIHPAEIEERGPYSKIDSVSLEATIQFADRLSGGFDNEAACDVIRYYLRFESWPDRIGAPDPLSEEEELAQELAQEDREFYDSLGQERSGTQCRREGCSRGAVAFSAFCRIHQFENVQKRACPFAH